MSIVAACTCFFLVRRKHARTMRAILLLIQVSMYTASTAAGRGVGVDCPTAALTLAYVPADAGVRSGCTPSPSALGELFAFGHGRNPLGLDAKTESFGFTAIVQVRRNRFHY